jgi:phospholipid/cholesterol/gamma-HCH transport system substrate-binding protein
MKIRKEIKIGAIAVISIVLFIWGYNFLKGSSLFASEYKIYAHYQKSGGIVQSDPVILNGFKIGQVDRIKFSPNNDGSLIVTLLMTNKFPLPSNSVAKIISTSITGSKGIDIILGNSETVLSDGDTIKAELDPSMIDALVQEVMPLKERFEDLIEQLQTTTKSVNNILNEESQAHLIATINNLQEISEALASQKSNLNNTMYHLNAFAQNLNSNSENLNLIMQNATDITTQIKQANVTETIDQLKQTIHSLNTVLSQLQQENSTVGQLIYSDTLHRELIRSNEQLQLLLEDVRNNPKKYIKLSLF